MDKNGPKKELRVELIGVNAIQPFFGKSSAARKAMFATHIGQAPWVAGSEPRSLITGVELEYGKYTFDIRFPCDCTVLKVLRKYPRTMGRDSIQHNPVTTIIYEENNAFRTIGVINVPDFASFHQDFGFPYKRNPDVWERLSLANNPTFAAGEVIAHSPAVREDGMYGLGVEAEVAFLSTPETIEDGFGVREGFLEKLMPTTYNTVVGNWGQKAYPLNLYGDDKVYKPFPDIGDRIRDDGLVFALREYDPESDLAVAEMTPRALRELDCFDRPIYGKPGAIVKDVVVYHDNRLNPTHTPVEMDTQARKYYDAACNYYQAILDEYDRLKRRRGANLDITREFHSLVVEAQIYKPRMDEKRKLTRVYRLETLDEWRVEVTYAKEMMPTVGFKLTDFDGGN